MYVCIVMYIALSTQSNWIRADIYETLSQLYGKIYKKCYLYVWTDKIAYSMYLLYGLICLPFFANIFQFFYYVHLKATIVIFHSSVDLIFVKFWPK